MSKIFGLLQAVGILLLSVFYIWFMCAMMFVGDGNGKYYNCTYSEISPDFPIEVKKKCRNGRI
jgi:hypothetical protein